MYIYIYIHYTFLSAEGFECLDTEIGHFTDMCIFQECYKWSNADSLLSPNSRPTIDIVKFPPLLLLLILLLPLLSHSSRRSEQNQGRS